MHCGNNAYTPPSDNEKCIMNADANRLNDIVRFCTDHVLNGFNSGEEPSVRDDQDNR
jgi:hypothetical protein